MNNKQNIYLIGFMGVGKTTVSKRLKQLTGWDEIDTDAEIIRRQGQSISDIFAMEGEKYFRQLEKELVQELSQTSGKIVSCGGGVALQEDNVAAMQAGGTVIWLKAKPSTIYEHVKNDHGRPILAGHMNVEYITELMSVREPWYEKAQTMSIDTDGKHSDQIAREIIEILHL